MTGFYDFNPPPLSLGARVAMALVACALGASTLVGAMTIIGWFLS